MILIYICDWACENRACGHMILPTFSNFHYTMTMKFSAPSKHLIGFMTQVTECKHSVPLLRYVFFLFYQGFTAQVLKVCRTHGPTACLKLLQKVCLKRWRKEKKSMTGPGQPRTCSHPINARMLTGYDL